MLKLKNVCKSYIVNKAKQKILDNITLDFDDRGLVLILGASGSGKSTLLNIIGGNLACDSGEILFNNRRINSLKPRELDSYRRTIVGTIFQDYNLIDYMNVYDNVALNCNSEMKKSMVMDILKQLKIYDKRYTAVRKLSGGEKQRVAIARTIVNDPKIILADEPTGSLDSQNGILVMEILRDISKYKLVIMVSHDKELTSKYADRVINIKDGKCTYEPLGIDTNEPMVFDSRKISRIRIFKLAMRNLWLKKLRTIISAIAISLGMMGIFTVINLYSNFDSEINDLERQVVSIFPITIRNGEYEIMDTKVNKSDNQIIIRNKNEQFYTNRINQKYIEYLNNIEEISYLNFDYDISMPAISDNYQLMDNKYLNSIPSIKYIDDNFNFLAGNNITNRFQILLKVDSNNNVPDELLNYFGISDNVSYDEVIGRKIKIIVNDQYYLYNNGYYIPNIDYVSMYEKSNIELTIVGIVKEKEVTVDESILYYDASLIDLLMDINSQSEIVRKQILVDYNVLGLNIGKNDMLSFLGYNTLPVEINIYVSNLSDKDKLIRYLDDYNLNNEKVLYVDTMSEAINILREFMMIIGIILIVFSVVSVIISLLLVGILTSVRVLECRKEIGILRNLGFSKKNIKELFNIENIILAIMAIIISAILVNLSVVPLNSLVNKYLDGANIFDINYVIFMLAGLFNIFIVREAGIIPAHRASKMDIISCIYNR